MKLLILTKAEAEANKGEYKPFHEIHPVKINEDFYILNRELHKIPELKAYKEAILKQPYFTKGDGSKFDKIYQKYLKDQEEENKIINV